MSATTSMQRARSQRNLHRCFLPHHAGKWKKNPTIILWVADNFFFGWPGFVNKSMPNTRQWDTSDHPLIIIITVQGRVCAHLPCRRMRSWSRRSSWRPVPVTVPGVYQYAMNVYVCMCMCVRVCVSEYHCLPYPILYNRLSQKPSDSDSKCNLWLSCAHSHTHITNPVTHIIHTHTHTHAHTHISDNQWDKSTNAIPIHSFWLHCFCFWQLWDSCKRPRWS